MTALAVREGRSPVQVSVLGFHSRSSLFSSFSIPPFLPNKKPGCQLPPRILEFCSSSAYTSCPSATRVYARITINMSPPPLLFTKYRPLTRPFLPTPTGRHTSSHSATSVRRIVHHAHDSTRLLPSASWFPFATTKFAMLDSYQYCSSRSPASASSRAPARHASPSSAMPSSVAARAAPRSRNAQIQDMFTYDGVLLRNEADEREAVVVEACSLAPNLRTCSVRLRPLSLLFNISRPQLE